MNDRLKGLADAGVSIWLDDLSRDRLNSGNLANLINESSVSGVTTNPTIFAAALSQGDAYAAQVREGMGLSRALAGTRQFPPILIHLTASGEATGRLDRMLERAAQELSRELSRRIEAFTTLLGPAVVLVMGGVVLFIVLAILLPVFEINQFVK